MHPRRADKKVIADIAGLAMKTASSKSGNQESGKS